MSDERVTTATVEAFLRDLVNSNKGIPLGRYEEEKVLRDLLDARAEHRECQEALARETGRRLTAEQRIKELEDELKSWQDRAYKIQETINKRTDRVKELEGALNYAIGWLPPIEAREELRRVLRGENRPLDVSGPNGGENSPLERGEEKG